MTAQPNCPECQSLGQLVGGDVIYPSRSDLSHKTFYKCPFCPDTYVGCHPGTTNPLGRMANKQLRMAKQRVHAVFDPLWEAKMGRERIAKGAARKKAYRWLAEQLNIPYDECHVGMFDAALCARAEAICRPYAQRLAANG